MMNPCLSITTALFVRRKTRERAAVALRALRRAA